MRVKYKLGALYPNPEYQRIDVDVDYCCAKMIDEYNDYSVAMEDSVRVGKPLQLYLYARIPSGYDDIYKMELSYCPFCGKKIEVVEDK